MGEGGRGRESERERGRVSACFSACFFCASRSLCPPARLSLQDVAEPLRAVQGGSIEALSPLPTCSPCGLRPVFSACRLQVLPPGMVERTDLLKALERLAIVKNAVPAGTAAAAKAVGERLAGAARPDLPSFTTDDLDTMPISKLKMFCIQFGRLPSGSLEKSDLKKALAPLAKPSTKPKQAFSGNGTASGHSHSHHHHKKRALPSFTATELDTMPISRLKSYCIQYGKMPHGPVERTDLVALLKPFAAAAGASSAPGSLGPGSATTAATSFGSQASSAKPAEADGGSTAYCPN